MPRQSAPADDARRLTRQLSLDLPVPKKRGGARPGAGRPRKKDADRAFIAHRERPSHRKADPVHVTLRVKRNVPSLRRQSMEKIVKRALLEQRDELTKTDAKHFQIVHFTIQTDHLHLIVEAADKRGLARGIAGLEVRIARRLNKLLRRKGRFWSDRYHRRDLRTPTETRNVLRYVLTNRSYCSTSLRSRNNEIQLGRGRRGWVVRPGTRLLREALEHLRTQELVALDDPGAARYGP